MATFKVIVVGDGGVGKSAWVKKLMSDEFEEKYVPTLGVEVHPIRIVTNDDIRIVANDAFDVWDCAGQDEEHYLEADGAIVMFDLTNKESYDNVSKWVDEIRRVMDGPIVFCGNKADVDVAYHTTTSYCSISVKDDVDVATPLVELAIEMGAQVRAEYE